MTVQSILFVNAVIPEDLEDRPEPAFFRHLNLDQIVCSVIKDKDEYALAPYFYAALEDPDEVGYRQQVFQDIEKPGVYELLTTFADQKLVAKYRNRSAQLRNSHRDFGHYHRARGFLNAVEQYCQAVARTAMGLAQLPVASRGLIELRDYLTQYVTSTAFVGLQNEAQQLEKALDELKYCLLVNGSRISVARFDDEDDYSCEVTETFKRFQQDRASKPPKARTDWQEESFAEIAVLHLVSQLYPELFASLDSFCQRHANYLDPTVTLADRELQFYLSYLAYIGPLRDAGLAFSYPQMSAESKDEQALETFDLALATQLRASGRKVVGNDVYLAGTERILVISGPNNGGKTTLARTIGQLHYLARLGCPVPGAEVRLFLCDQIFTHFEKQEDISTLAGKLQDELNRLQIDLDHASSSSLLILNEVFNSTTVADAQFLSRKILQQICDLDALGVCVTFLDELSTLNEKTVSMVSQVAPEDPAIRTHKVIRMPADGRAYARAIAQKYGLTHDQITSGRRSQ